MVKRCFRFARARQLRNVSELGGLFTVALVVDCEDARCDRGIIRPFLIQSDSASRKQPFSTGLLFDWILLVFLLIVSRVDFIVFMLFLGAVGVREYCCTAGEIGWQPCASRFLREQRLDEPSSQRVGGFGLSRKPPKLRSWSCTQPRAAKATAGAAVVGSMGSRPRAAALV